MTALPHPETETSAGPADWARPLYARQVEMLGVLAEAGLELALAVKDRAMAEPEGDPAQAMMAYGRAARAVRLTLMLQAQLIKALEDRDLHRDYLVRSAVRDQRREKQARVERIVERVAVQDGRGAREVERLVQEACERLDEDDIHDLLSLPVSELVALVCHDLGLDPDWPRLAQEAWAHEEMASGLAGRPLAALSPGPADASAPLIPDPFNPSG